MSRNTKKISTKKPYCKVCHDAGKPESEYTSHWVKDLTGKTTCPTLLDTECRYCHNLGHTSKFCDSAKKSSSDFKSDVVTKEQPKKKVQVVKKQGNGFAALCCDSESDDEDSSEGGNKRCPIVKESTLTGWAAIAAKPKEEVKAPVAPLAPGMVVLIKKSKKEPEPKAVAAPKPAPWAKKDVVVTKKWADWSDSEYEDDVPEYATGEVESYADGWD